MATTTTAAHFASFHKPGDPLVIPNIWDLSSLNTVLSLNISLGTALTPVRAVATASYAIAATLIRIHQLAPRVRAAGLPLTVDIQDAYGDRLEDVVGAVVEAGAVGANVEDIKDEKDAKEGEDLLYSLEEQVKRLKRVLKVAADNGCPGFVVNARCDVMSPASRRGAKDEDVAEQERLLRETIRRGKAYLAAGATTVFVWGGPQRGLREREVRVLADAFGGRLAVKLGAGEDALSVKELADMGVARISVGPSLYQAGNKTIRDTAERIVGGGRL
ncbi:hypothetical protein RRF57_002354 [Xylaria bambusicola]|uniref:Phosphoenolpyruvate/pyruvate domain-containing protein n=1 Tax=Xylaria bambusicola TaxID=326684 RepID=A0AAN7UIW2_9PEZI